MKTLELPPTISNLTVDDVPNTPDILEKIKRRNGANIFEGYTIFGNEDNEYPYRFFARINIDNSRLWNLFKALFVQLPEEIACIYHHIDNEPTLGSYDDKFSILHILDEYETEITKDGFIEIGVIAHYQDFLEEVFITKWKYINY
jgi:hypothetical protein